MMHKMPDKDFHDPLTAERRLDRDDQRRAFRDWLRAAAADRSPDGIHGGPFWYLIRVRRGREWQTAADLRKCGIRAWCPRRIAVEKRPRGKGKRRFRQVICPGYLFVQLAPCAHAVLGVLSFDGQVLGFVGAGERPYQVRSCDISALRDEVARLPSKKESGLSLFTKGALLMITDGPFVGFDGPVTRPDNNLGRVSVEVSIFGRPTNVELEIDQVRPL